MSVQVTIARTHQRADGTFGVLSISDLPIAVTLERPWADNQKGVSCIPAGTYVAKRVQSPKFGETFEVTDVTGRDHILFHWGNRFVDSHGCILLGEGFNVWADGTASIGSSKIAFAEFSQWLANVDSFELTIKDYWRA